MSEFFDLPSRQECRFAIVDAAAFELIPEGLITGALVPKGLTHNAHLLPGLIDLHLLTDDQWIALCAGLQEVHESLQASSIPIFVATSSSKHVFARHWNAVQIPKPRGTREFWLRAHDPRVIHQLLRILNDMQRRWLFGPVHAFYYWIGNRWNTAFRDPEEPVARQEGSIGPAGWDWPRIGQLGIVNRALSGAGIHDLPSLTTRGALAEQLISRAVTRHGLSKTTDLVEFTTRGLLFGCLFDEHPKIATAIKVAVEFAETTNLSDHLALIDSEVWTSFINPSIHLTTTGHERDEDLRIL